jgi:hypothetical protein
MFMIHVFRHPLAAINFRLFSSRRDAESAIRQLRLKARIVTIG